MRRNQLDAQADVTGRDPPRIDSVTLHDSRPVCPKMSPGRRSAGLGERYGPCVSRVAAGSGPPPAASRAATRVQAPARCRAAAPPQQILAQTTLKKTGAAVLVLLVGGKPGAAYKAAAVAPMLPDAKLDALDAATDGSAAVGEGEG